METTPTSSLATGLKKSSFVKWCLVLAIAIVTNLFMSYATQVLYP